MVRRSGQRCGAKIVQIALEDWNSPHAPRAAYAREQGVANSRDNIYTHLLLYGRNLPARSQGTAATKSVAASP